MPLKKFLLTTVAAVALVATPVMFNSNADQAAAKSEKSQGNGPDKDRGSRSASADRAAERQERKQQRILAREQAKAARDVAKAERAVAREEAKVAKTESKALPNRASMLGALNAAHASPMALAHASPNSRVGKIALYKEAAVEALAAQDAANELAEPLLDAGLTEEDLAALTDAGGYEAFVAEVDARIAIAEEDLAALEGAEGFDPDNPGDEYLAIEAAIEADNDLLDLADANRDGLEEYADAYDAYVTESDEARAILEDAANKPITDDNYVEISTEVNRLLGINEMVAVLDEEPVEEVVDIAVSGE